MSRVLSFGSGILVIFMALFFKSLKELSLFDLMMSVSAMIQVPLLIPLILGLFIKKTPNWAPWATVFLGLVVSWLMKEVFTPQLVASWLGMNVLTAREVVDMESDVNPGGPHIYYRWFFSGPPRFFTVLKTTATKHSAIVFLKTLKRR